MKNPCLDAALAVLEECGIRDREVAAGSKHPQVRFRINGGPALHVFAIPGTASDWRSPQNVRRDLRKVLRELGVIVTEERPEPPPRPAPKPSRLDECVRDIAELKQQMETLEGLLRALAPGACACGEKGLKKISAARNG
jgi:hypothetical protein